MLVDQIEREQRMAQMIEHADEEHDVEPLAERADVVDRELAELDVEPVHLGGEPGLRQIVLVEIDARARAPRRAASSPSSRSRHCSRYRARSCPARSAGIACGEALPI